MKTFKIFGAKFIKLNFPNRNIFYSPTGFAVHIFYPERGYGESESIAFCNCCYFIDNSIWMQAKLVEEFGEQKFLNHTFSISRKSIRISSSVWDAEYKFYPSVKEFYRKRELSNLLG